MPIKILQINTVINYNATGRIAEEIGQEALKRGWESYIAYGRNTRESRSKLIKIGSKWDFLFHLLLNRLFDLQGFGSKNATRKFIKQIEQLQPDIIHLHNLHGYYIHLGILFNYLSKTSIPVVWTLHDCWSFTGHCAYFDYVHCDKWRTGCFKCPQKNQYPISWFADRSRQNYNAKNRLFNSIGTVTIVSVSSWLEGLVRQSFLKNGTLELIRNGIDLSVFKPRENVQNIKDSIGVGGKMMLLGIASVWEPRKGLPDFIKLSAKIPEDTVIVLVGLSTSQIKQLPPSIIGIQRTENRAQLIELYAAADLFLNLTYEDNYPTTNMEAMACGTPVLTYDTGGSVESVTEENGFIIEKGHIDAICNVIERLRGKDNSDLRTSCRKFAEARFDKDSSYAQYFEIYNKFIIKDSKV